MRRRINRTLLAATAASVSVIGLGFMAAGAAGAATTSAATTAAHSITNPVSGGAPVYTPPCAAIGGYVTASDNGGCAGYVATGRDFRYAAALITVPNVPGSATSPI